MNEKNPQQRNEKKHRKLIRSPEKLSPCDFDPFYNPSLLSASANVFINTNQFQPTTNHSRSSPTKTYNDQFPPQQQIWFNNESPQHQQFSSNATLPPSSSSPSIALHRKPSITIKYSKDDDLHHTSSTSSPALHQKISKSIDLNHPFIMTSSTISSEMKDQMSNNFLINFPGCYDVNSSSSSLSLKNQQQHQQQIIEKNLSPFNYNDEFNNSSNVYNTKSTDIYHQSSPVSQSSLNLNLIVNQHQQQQQQIISNSICGGQIVFNSNNPFLNDNFDSITNDISGNDGNKLDNFFNIHDSNDSELLFLSDEVTTTTTIEHGTMMKENDDNLNQQDEQALKNKREKFSNASPTMKICLVVSPPTNKLFQLKSKSLTHLDRIQPQINISSNDIPYKVSSSEYFSVCFDTENGFKDKDEIFIAATKGIALGDSLRQAMIQRSLSFSRISVIDYGMNNSNELGIPQYFGPLHVNTDIGILAGHSLLVTEKENVQKKSGHYVLKKANSVGYRTTTSRLFSSVSTEECLETNDTTKVTKQTKQRLWSLQLFGVKNPQQNQLCELLNTYTKNGVPKSKSSYINSEYSDEALEALYGLPQSWRDFVNPCDISEIETKIQSAIWELVATEVDYIHAIQTVTDLFLSCLEGIQSENLLKDIDQHKLFSNIRDIVDANLKLWSLYLYPMVKHSMLTGHLMCIDYFQQGFTNFACIFEPYTKYCAEQVLCQNYCKDLNRNNALFTSYLAWCEAQKECNRLRLADILVRPMQRLTKYNLLLSAIRKHLTEETEAEIMDNMIHSVDEFVCSVNSHLTTRQENERLKGIMARIESYDVVDSNNESLEKLIKQYSQMFDLCAPMKGCAISQGRYLFLEGDMKYKDNNAKMDVHCFLLTDILLICKQTAKKGHGNLKVIRQPFMTDRLVIKLREKENAIHCVYLNDFNMVIAAFVLQCPEAKNWYEGITKARHIFTKLKQGTFVDAQGHSVKVPQQHHYLLNNTDSISIRKSPVGSSIVSSLNNSHSGSVELNESKTVSVDFDKTNSISSDEGSYNLHKAHSSASNRKLRQTSSNSLTVQSFSTHLNQSMPNLTSGPYHTNSHSTLLCVPGATKSHSAHSSHSGNLLSPSQRGISYPPPSPTRATLRRGFAFSSSINNKNPPLIKSRNVTSQHSINWTQQQSMAAQQQQQLGLMATAAGTASSTLQAQSSQIQVVYEPVEQSKSTDATNQQDIDSTRNETT
ncbi:uncharacterized protein [Chironomus tepperi]|uniref:uncharacterized protein isoform X4 n=1 Tax=Chironomus tepperi TaxID=113505 RepID=UPI00391F2C08